MKINLIIFHPNILHQIANLSWNSLDIAIKKLQLAANMAIHEVGLNLRKKIHKQIHTKLLEKGSDRKHGAIEVISCVMGLGWMLETIYLSQHLVKFESII